MLLQTMSFYPRSHRFLDDEVLSAETEGARLCDVKTLTDEVTDWLENEPKKTSMRRVCCKIYRKNSG
jgi:hypothetical protein